MKESAKAGVTQRPRPRKSCRGKKKRSTAVRTTPKAPMRLRLGTAANCRRSLARLTVWFHASTVRSDLSIRKFKATVYAINSQLAFLNYQREDGTLAEIQTRIAELERTRRV